MLYDQRTHSVENCSCEQRHFVRSSKTNNGEHCSLCWNEALNADFWFEHSLHKLSTHLIDVSSHWRIKLREALCQAHELSHQKLIFFLNKASLDSKAAVCKILSNIVFDALGPNSLCSLCQESINSHFTAIRWVSPNPPVGTFHLKQPIRIQWCLDIWITHGARSACSTFNDLFFLNIHHTLLHLLFWLLWRLDFFPMRKRGTNG